MGLELRNPNSIDLEMGTGACVEFIKGRTGTANYFLPIESDPAPENLQ